MGDSGSAALMDITVDSNGGGRREVEQCQSGGMARWSRAGKVGSGNTLGRGGSALTLKLGPWEEEQDLARTQCQCLLGILLWWPH